MELLSYTTLLALCLLALSRISSSLSFPRRYSKILAETLPRVAPLKNINDDMLYEVCSSVQQPSNSTIDELQYDNYQQSPLLGDPPEVVKAGTSFLSSFGLPTQYLGISKSPLDNLSASEIFRSIKIGRDWNWGKAFIALDAIVQCEAVKKYTKSFEIDLFIGDTWLESIQEDRVRRGPRPPARFPLKLLEVMSSLADVEKMILIIPECHTEIFRTTFQEANFTFPKVRTLVLGPHMDWIIAMCPNVETISTNDWRWLHSNVDGDYGHRHSTDLIHSAGRAKHLRHLELIEWWTLEQLEMVYRAMPSIPSLAMPGDSYSDGIETLIPTLSRFENLTSLMVGDAHTLRVGFDPPGCGNVYFGPEGKKFRQQVIEEGIMAEEKVASMVFAKLAKLEDLWIGDRSRANVTRNESGGVDEISWSHCRRTKAYDYWN